MPDIFTPLLIKSKELKNRIVMGAAECTDPQKLDLKSSNWRSVFLWQNIVMN